VSHGSGRIDYGIQQLIIPGGRETEDLADRFLLGSRVLREPRLERQDGAIALRQLVLIHSHHPAFEPSLGAWSLKTGEACRCSRSLRVLKVRIT